MCGCLVVWVVVFVVVVNGLSETDQRTHCASVACSMVLEQLSLSVSANRNVLFRQTFSSPTQLHCGVTTATTNATTAAATTTTTTTTTTNIIPVVIILLLLLLIVEFQKPKLSSLFPPSFTRLACFWSHFTNPLSD